MVSKFNIRVYGIWVRDKKILVSHENIDGFAMIKLPGGGLKLGEGIRDGLIREFQEELEIQINPGSLIYITEHFIQSQFRSEEQVIALYYCVDHQSNPDYLSTIQSTRLGKANTIHFEWLDLNEALKEILSFDSDKEAVSKVLSTMD